VSQRRAVIETERLLLREFVPGDLDFLVTMFSDPDLNRFYERQFSRDDAVAWLNRQMERYRQDGHGLWLLEDRVTGQPYGHAGLGWQDVEGGRYRYPEVGWLLHRPHWGRGYATEAARATRDAARDRWGYPAVISLIRPGNLRSMGVAERIGMRPGRLVRFKGFEHIIYGVDLDARVGRQG
jgi:[ribosomal protein S5]-alanine N-acetyltransferase